MLSNKSAGELSRIARNGGSLTVDGSCYSASELSRVAGNLRPGAMLTILKSDNLSASEMSRVARNASDRASTNFS